MTAARESVTGKERNTNYNDGEMLAIEQQLRHLAKAP